MAESALSGSEINLEHWMAHLPQQLKDTPIIYLAIPGSHDSMSYGISRSSKLAPDAEPILHSLFPLFRGTIIRWTITQSANIIQQLNLGIRYFDMRLATMTGTEDFYFTHGLYADEITKALLQVRDYLDTHSGEIVILDFQHFYGFTESDHQRLIKMLIDMYNKRLCPRLLDVKHVTLNSMARLKEQVIIVYRHQSVYSTVSFWQPQMIPTPWPQQEKPNELIKFFEHIRRHPGMGFVHQAVLTPTPRFILFRWLSNLREKCAVPVIMSVLPKLAEYSPGPPHDTTATVNVVISDFIDIENGIFSKTIIDMNLKLLRNVDVVYHK